MSDFTKADEKIMRQAIRLGKMGRSATKSNPLVGAVIVKDGIVIGSGYHKLYGGPHAEIEAINSVQDPSQLKGATMYVTLEPCCHQGKTPPCTKRIIKEGFSKVVIASLDPNPKVSGQGVKELREAGIEVEVGLLDEEAQQMNEKYVFFMTNRIPFVLMKSATTLDGKIATREEKSMWISCDKARRYTRKLRGEYQAIMVGINTVLADDPKLTTRLKGEIDPIKILVDPLLEINPGANIIKTSRETLTIVFTSLRSSQDKKEKLESLGVQVYRLEDINGKLRLSIAMKMLAEMGIASILLEGGGGMNFEMLRQGFVNKVLFVIAPKLFGGRDAKTSVEGIGFAEVSEAVRVKDIRIKKIDTDVMLTAYIDK